MADRWIITKYRFHQHQSLLDAQTELARLQKEMPNVPLTIIRIKTRLEASNAPEIIATLSKSLQELAEICASYAFNKFDERVEVDAQERARAALRKAGME